MLYPKPTGISTDGLDFIKFFYHHSNTPEYLGKILTRTLTLLLSMPSAFIKPNS